MATKKDLVEAYSFSRRRLVTAFVSGAPGGREVEPARPGRSIVGGLALSVLLVAGAAIAGIFTGRPDIDWSEPGMFLSKERGALYVVLPGTEEAELRPVINVTSAQLILGADVTPEIVAQDEIDQQHVGDDIGILGAPADVPTPGSLVPSGWTACTFDGRGIAVVVGDGGEVTPVPEAGFTVRTGDDVYVVAQSRGSATEESGAYAYAVPGDAAVQDRVLSGLQLPNTAAAMSVTDRWLNLFPEGAPLSLESFGIDGFGDRPDDTAGLPASATVGDWFTFADRGYVLTKGGPAPLSDFEYRLYVALAQDSAQELSVTELVVEQGGVALDATRWPDREPTPEPGEPCAQLVAVEGEPPRVLLATDPTGAASAVAVTNRPDDVERSVQDGIGAFVHAATWGVDEGGSPFLVTARPNAHELVGPEVADKLGYGEVDAPVVPNAWIELFEAGVPLSVEAALCPPSSRAATGSACS